MPSDNNAIERTNRNSLQLPQTDNSDDLTPLLTVIGAVSAIFWAGMMGDHIGPLLRTQAVVEIARAHTTALVLAPAITCVSLVVVAFLRLIVGPFNVRIRKGDVEIRGGAVAFVAWLICVLLEIGVVKLLW
jgi:hypothetical protein